MTEETLRRIRAIFKDSLRTVRMISKPMVDGPAKLLNYKGPLEGENWRRIIQRMESRALKRTLEMCSETASNAVSCHAILSLQARILTSTVLRMTTA